MSARRRVARGACAAALVAGAASLAATPEARAQSLAGTWTEAERSMDVTIESWGEDCPTAPRSSSSRPNTPIEVQVQSDQLVFPGGRRSDRCWSDNPALRRTRFSKSGNRYVVECQTPSDDARQEHGTYVTTAEQTRITIEITSDYDWTLREAHCKARIVERRVLTRAPPPAPDAGTVDAADVADGRDAADVRETADVSWPRVGEAAAAVPPPAPRTCDRPGAPARLRLRSVRTVAPGGRAQISVHQVDANGCDLGPVSASFEIVGPAKDCRVGSDGVFRACEAVAVCDGETVRVRATAGGLSAGVDIRVSARLEEGLGTVEPVWTEEPAGPGPEGPGGGAQVATSLHGQPSTAGPAGGEGPGPAGAAGTPGGAAPGTGRPTGKAEPSGSSLALWLVIGGAGLVVVAVVVYLIASGRRKKPLDAGLVDDLGQAAAAAGPPVPGGGYPPAPPGPPGAYPFVPPGPPGGYPPGAPAPPGIFAPPAAGPPGGVPGAFPPPAPPAAPGMAGFGPLAPPGPQILAPPPPPPPPTWHCPACRKESPAAGFCTEDGIELANGPPPPPARQILFLACPKCGRAYSRDSKFCPNDRELLLPYGMGMNDYRARHKSDPVPAQRVCPKCGRVSAGTARFCPNEGEPLPT